jgi:hypothetical protein
MVAEYALPKEAVMSYSSLSPVGHGHPVCQRPIPLEIIVVALVLAGVFLSVVVALLGFG